MVVNISKVLAVEANILHLW